MLKETLVYIGTYTRGRSKGVYLFRLPTQNLEVSQNITLVPLGLAAETTNPSFLEIDETRRLLFAVNAQDQFEGRPTGAVSAFSVDPATGTLKRLNQRPSMGTGPCHLVLDRCASSFCRRLIERKARIVMLRSHPTNFRHRDTETRRSDVR